MKNLRLPKRAIPGPSRPVRHRRRKPFAPGLEGLEERQLLATDAGLSAIVVGRTLSSTTLAGVQGGELTITYTVYNQQADEVTGVLLTTTLQPGVAVKGASVPPDRNGSELAWSLGTL